MTLHSTAKIALIVVSAILTGHIFATRYPYNARWIVWFM